MRVFPHRRFAIWHNSQKRLNKSVALPIDLAMRKVVRESPNILDHFGTLFDGSVRLQRANSF
jgi:hypothetical protein